MLIREQAQKAQLGDAAEGDSSVFDALQPSLGPRMVDMPVGSKPNPEIDVRQADHRSRSPSNPERRGFSRELEAA